MVLRSRDEGLCRVTQWPSMWNDDRGLWGLTPLSIVFQLYRSGQCFIDEGNRSTRRKSPTFCKSLTKLKTTEFVSMLLFSHSKYNVGRRRVWRYQRGNQNSYIEEEQTTQWPKEEVQKDKQRSTKHI
jgi:hypothetical protein